MTATPADRRPRTASSRAPFLPLRCRSSLRNYCSHTCGEQGLASHAFLFLSTSISFSVADIVQPTFLSPPYKCQICRTGLTSSIRLYPANTQPKFPAQNRSPYIHSLYRIAGITSIDLATTQQCRAFPDSTRNIIASVIC
jgi:hypothetical protein